MIALPSPEPSPSRPPRWNVVWPAAVMVMIFIASGREKMADPGGIPHLDKYTHFLVFGLLATLVLRMFYDERRRAYTAAAAAIFVSVYGLADEYRQSFTPGRLVEVSDWVADTLGASVAVAAYAFWEGYRRFLERRVPGSANSASSGVAPVASGSDAQP